MAQTHGRKNNHDPIVAYVEKEILNTNPTRSIQSRERESMPDETIGLFRKYLHPNTQHGIGKANEQEAEVMKRSRPRGLFPPKSDTNFHRHPSFLEQELLPGSRTNTASLASSFNKSSTPQLTIFYSGDVNVYDNVPMDRVQAIMLLAGESSLSPLTSTDPLKPLYSAKLPSVCELKAELQIARKQFLQRFLEKRRDRQTNKSPYKSPCIKQESVEPAFKDCMKGDKTFSPSPFPSRLGFSIPSSTQITCKEEG